jgi:uncharacterized caspase-like protein
MVKRALLIGINYYTDSNLRLYGCINDAMNIHNMLIDAYDYKKSNITVLRDDINDSNYLPTARNIIMKLYALFRNAKNDDELWIHYSGHGMQVNDYGREEKDRKDECIVPIDYSRRGVITDDLLYHLLRFSKAKVYITMDCCHSGTIFDLQYNYDIVNGTQRRFIDNKRLNNKNIYMFSACRDSQQAIDAYNYEQQESSGTFTNALIESLRYNHHNVDVLKLHKDINTYLNTLGLPQNCIFSTSNSSPNHNISKSNTFNGVTQKLVTSNIVLNNMRAIIGK